MRGNGLHRGAVFDEKVGALEPRANLIGFMAG
jgi:hypothetical protein